MWHRQLLNIGNPAIPKTANCPAVATSANCNQPTLPTSFNITTGLSWGPWTIVRIAKQHALTISAYWMMPATHKSTKLGFQNKPIPHANLQLSKDEVLQLQCTEPYWSVQRPAMRTRPWFKAQTCNNETIWLDHHDCKCQATEPCAAGSAAAGGHGGGGGGGAFKVHADTYHDSCGMECNITVLAALCALPWCSFWSFPCSRSQSWSSSCETRLPVSSLP